MKKINTFSRDNVNKYAVAAVLIGLALLPLLAMAQGQPGRTGIITQPSDITKILTGVLNWIIGVIFIIALIMIFYAAVLYITAGASETAHSKAKGILIFAIVGIAIAILAFSFRPFIQSILIGFDV